MPCEGVSFPAPQVDLWARGDLEPIVVRPVHGSDTERVAEFVRGLSQASRYQRFHVGLRELPLGMAERFVRYDRASELALVATLCVDGRETAVAEARHAAVEDDPSTHEFALVVHDELRRAGLGERLLLRLIAHARAIGLQRLIGDVQRDNPAMLGLAAKLGFVVRRHPEDPRLLRVELRLPAADGAPADFRVDAEPAAWALARELRERTVQ
jgi:acetyltransferase